VIAFLDTNTIWRRKFAEAVARLHPTTLLCAPRAPGKSPTAGGSSGDWRINLPPGWASRLAPLTMPYLANRLAAQARGRGECLDRLFLTSFHYLRIAQSVRPTTEIFYYCSDDYRSYGGWGGPANIAKERELCLRSTLAIFVSEALRKRAVREYGMDEARTLVLPNASEQRFSEASPVPLALSELPRPVFGTVGVFNARVDYRFLLDVARRDEVGSLALVGPVGDVGDQRQVLRELAALPKVRFFGAQPHEDVHAWMAGLDVGVIPYAASALNHFCSPMRLYDHLAVGHPILATDACAQVAARRDIFVAKGSGVGQAVREAAEAVSRGRHPALETWDDRAAMLEIHRP
jgi:glycosyltransferase involved in cell wall biosynthesis